MSDRRLSRPAWRGRYLILWQRAARAIIRALGGLGFRVGRFRPGPDLSEPPDVPDGRQDGSEASSQPVEPRPFRARDLDA